LTFQNACYTQETAAFQVERSRFDQILLQHAAASGAEVREGWTVTRFEDQADCVLVEARSGAKTTKFKAGFLLDASGRANLTGNQEGLRIVHPHLKKLAVFGHFDGVLLDEGTRRADTVIVRSEDHWFWIIPLSEQKVSVGCVIDQQNFASLKLSPAEAFQRLCQSSAAMRKRMANARPLNPIQTTSDFSYYNRRLSGNRLLRVGDAAGFMDPIFSAGVYLAMYSGRLGARTAISALDAPESASEAMRAYEKRVYKALRFYWELVEGFYTRPFMELFLEPRHRLKIPEAIVAILAGELDGGWRIEWRKRLFFLLIRIQRFYALVPRISYSQAEEWKR
jgi:FADH2-dependent halogenase